MDDKNLKTTKDLDKLLNDERGETQMAEDKRNVILDRAKTGKEKREEEGKTVTPEVKTEEAINAEIEKAITEEDPIDAMIKKEEEANAAIEADSVLQQTNHFGGEGGLNTNLTEEELAKERAKAQREAEIAEKTYKHNTFITQAHSKLQKDLTGAKPVSEAQKRFQMVSQQYTRCGGFIVENDAAPELKITKKYLVEDDAQKTVKLWDPSRMNEYNVWLRSTDKSGNKKANFVQHTTQLKLNYKAARGIIGAIISRPTPLNIDIEGFTDEKFKLDADELKVAGIIHNCFSYDTVFTIGQVFCGGTMLEAEYMNDPENKFEAKARVQKLNFNFKFSKVLENGIEKEVSKKSIGTDTRPSLLVQENVIPMSRVKSAPISRLSAESQAAYVKFLKERLKAAKGEERSNYSVMIPKHQGLFQVRMSPDGKVVEDLSTSLFTGAFYNDNSYDLKMNHWSNVIANPIGGTIKKEPLMEALVPIKYIPVKTDGTLAETPRDMKVFFGAKDGYSLEQLAAEGYKAAQYALDNEVSVDSIATCYELYLAEKREAQQARALSNPKRASKPRRLSNILDQNTTTQLILAELASKTSRDVVDKDRVAGELQQSYFKFGTRDTSHIIEE